MRSPIILIILISFNINYRNFFHFLLPISFNVNRNFFTG